MRIFDRYIAKQVLMTTVIGVVMLSLVLVLGNLFKEIRPLLVESGAPVSIVLRFVLEVLPFSLMFTIPWGFLTAVLLVYGRLSADNELTCMRMAGCSLWRLSLPVIVIGACFSLFSYWINTSVSPRAKRNISELFVQAVAHDPKSLLDKGQTQTKFSGQQLIVDQRNGDKLEGLHIYQNRTKTQPEMVLHARDVELKFDPGTRYLQLDMQKVFVETASESGEVQSAIIEKMPWQLDLSRLSREKIKANRYTNDEIREMLSSDILNKRQRAEFSTELTRRISFSLACVMFGFIAVPLAMQTRRRDTSTGFAIGIGVAAMYFLALIFADMSRKSGGMVSHILLWLPNIVTLIVGFWMYRKAQNQG